MTRTLTILAAAVAALAVSAGAASAGTSTVRPPGGTATINLENTIVSGYAAGRSQGIIMRDGGICDPIRHMGC